MPRRACPKDADTRLADAIAARDPAEATRALDDGAGLERLDVLGMTPLLRAVLQRDVAMTRLLLARGAVPEPPRVRNGMPLHYAAESGCIEMVELLLAAGVDPDARWTGISEDGGPLAEHGRTPLFLAARHPAVLAALVRGGADVRATDHAGRNALFGHVLHHPEFDQVTNLLAVGVDPDQRDADGDSAAMIAYERVLRLARFATGPDSYEARTGALYQRLLDAMLAAGAGRAGFVHIDLIEACQRGDADAVRAALAAGADAKHRGNGPLRAAATADRADLVRLLVAHGADLDRPGEGWHVLTWAAHHGRLAAVRACIELGADRTVEDHGRDALRWSKTGRHAAVEAYLRALPPPSRRAAPRPRPGVWSRDQNDQCTAIRAAAADAARLVAQVLGGTARPLDVLHGALQAGDRHLVLRLAGQEWALVYGLGASMSEADAARLAAAPGAPEVLWYANSDTAGSVEYRRWRDGQVVESFASVGGRPRFVSHLRAVTDDDLRPCDAFVDTTARALGVSFTGLAFPRRPAAAWRLSSVHEPEELDGAFAVGGSTDRPAGG